MDEQNIPNPSFLRKTTLAARDALSAEERERKNSRIEQKICTMEEVKKAKSFFIYVNFRSEVKTFDIISRFIREGKTVTVPVTRVKAKRIDAIRILHPRKELVPGYCGIPEPEENIWKSRRVNPENIDIIFLPGSVFDERGGRFGYGGGYYDRFLARIPQTTRISLAYELQIRAKLPLQDHDERMDYIVTEKRIIKGKRQRLP